MDGYVFFEVDNMGNPIYGDKMKELLNCEKEHILFILSKDVALSYVVEEIKRNSSRWIKSLSPKYHMFAWQGGYGAFSVSQSVVSKTLQYIKGQREHHKRVSFADEYKAFLISYNIEYDERYVFKD